MKIVWTSLALEDLNSVFSFTQEKYGKTTNLAERLEKVFEILTKHPEAGRSGRVKGTREILIPGTPLIIVYRLASGRIEFLAVIHGARKWP